VTPPPDPIRLSVLKSMQTALQGISTAAGYYFDVRAEAVTLDRRNLATATLLPAFVINSGAGGTRTYFPSMRMREIFPVVIYGRADAMGIRDMSRRQTIFERLVADLERALTRDITRGGLAVDTRLQSPLEPYMEMDPINSVYIEQPVDVTLRRVYGTGEVG
jgi:hypothetical protein